MMKKCNFCGKNSFTNKNVQYIYRRDNQFLVVNNVPCEECDFCGEQYYKADVLKNIETEFNSISLGEKKAKNEVSVPVEEYKEIAI